MSTFLAAAAVGDPPGAGLHAVNGDGASLCEQVAAEDLVHPDDLTWDMVPSEMRCGRCQALLVAYGRHA